MSDGSGPIITILVGLAVLVSTWIGTHTNYVKAGLLWPLIVSGVVLILVGGAGLYLGRRGQAHHDGHGAEAIGGLLVVFAVALVFAPPPLGAAAAADRIPNRVAFSQETPGVGVVPAGADMVDAQDEVASAGEAEPNPPSTDGPSVSQSVTDPNLTSSGAGASTDEGDIPLSEPGVDGGGGTANGDGQDDSADPTDPNGDSGLTAYEISLYDFIGYTLFAADEVEDVRFQFVGFVAPEPDVPGAFRLTRFLMSCCAADAFPLQVTLVDAPFIPGVDQWVVAEAVWRGELTDVDEYGEGVPVLETLSLSETDPPINPYEY